MGKDGIFSVMQGGMEVASGSGPLADCIREAKHYAFIYNQDGPVKVYINGKELISHNPKEAE